MSYHESHLGILSVSDASPWDQHIFGECADPRLRTHLKCAFKSVTGRGGGGRCQAHPLKDIRLFCCRMRISFKKNFYLHLMFKTLILFR